MPFGIICVQDKFQQKIKKIFGKLKGVGTIVDAIFVFGKDEEHDENFEGSPTEGQRSSLTWKIDIWIYKHTILWIFGYCR